MDEEKNIEAWCCRCKKKTEMKDIELSKTKKGIEMRKGICSVCECKMCRFGRIK